MVLNSAGHMWRKCVPLPKIQTEGGLAGKLASVHQDVVEKLGVESQICSLPGL